MAVTFACERLVAEEDLTCECDLPVDVNLVESVLDGASDFLSQLAGYPLGRCVAAYRPCRDDWCTPQYCRCCGLTGIHLPGLEATLAEVWLDGVELTANTHFKVVNAPFGRPMLIRIVDGELGRWPTCMNLWKDRTEVGTFEIVVQSGVAINQLMILAAAEIACDIFAYLAGADHLLPAGIVSASALGVTMNARLPFDPTRKVDADLTGFTWVPRFLNSLPTTSGTEVISPELDDGWTLWPREAVLTP